MRFAVSTALVLLSVQLAYAETASITRSGTPWTFAPEFSTKGKANTAISGAACVPQTGHCLAVNDETRFAQFFEISDQRITPTAVIALLSESMDGVKMNELDAEAADYVPPATPGAPGYYYVTGSHGASRKGELQPSRFFLVRFPVDPATGAPTFSFDDKQAAPQIAHTSALRAALSSLPGLAPFAERRLDQDGLNVEGLAIMKDEALFGLRGPCISGKAFVVRVPVADLFANATLTPVVSELTLGENVGIRDLARVQDGVLILSGRSNDEKASSSYNCESPGPAPLPPAEVWFWKGGKADVPRRLGALPEVPPDWKAEALLVLSEDASSYRVLVWFDGRPNGAPTEFTIHK